MSEEPTPAPQPPPTPVNPMLLQPTPFERIVLADGREFILSRAKVRHQIDGTVIVGNIVEPGQWNEVFDCVQRIPSAMIDRKIAIGRDPGTGTFHDAPHLEPWSRAHA